MKALKIMGTTNITSSPLVSRHHKGDAPADIFRRQATGRVPRVILDLRPARVICTTFVKDGDIDRRRGVAHVAVDTEHLW